MSGMGHCLAPRLGEGAWGWGLHRALSRGGLWAEQGDVRHRVGVHAARMQGTGEQQEACGGRDMHSGGAEGVWGSFGLPM